jgi:hypothetical protein
VALCDVIRAVDKTQADLRITELEKIYRFPIHYIMGLRAQEA